MSVQNTVPYISLIDQVVATTDGYTLRFVAGETTQVPNFKNVVAACRSAGCVPAEEIGAQVRGKLGTIEDHREAEDAARSAAIQMAILTVVERGLPADFTRAGVPQNRALEQLTGFASIKNTERDMEWKKYLENKGE